MVVDVDTDAEINSIGSDEAILGKALEEAVVVLEECILGIFSPHARPCPSPWSDVSVPFECEDIDGIMAQVMHTILKLHEPCGEPSPPLLMISKSTHLDLGGGSHNTVGGAQSMCRQG